MKFRSQSRSFLFKYVGVTKYFYHLPVPSVMFTPKPRKGLEHMRHLISSKWSLISDSNLDITILFWVQVLQKPVELYRTHGKNNTQMGPQCRYLPFVNALGISNGFLCFPVSFSTMLLHLVLKGMIYHEDESLQLLQVSVELKVLIVCTLGTAIRVCLPTEQNFLDVQHSMYLK